MPGLTLNTDASPPRASVTAPAAGPPPGVPSSSAAPASAPASAAGQPQQALQPAPPAPPQAPPAAAPAAAQTPRPPSSPTRPPISPITPPLGPTHLGASVVSSQQQQQQRQLPPPPPAQPSFAAGRPALTHAAQAEQDACAVPPPPPVPLDFDANPDVLALKSAISILQLQRARAAADIAALGRAKDAALADPEAFLRDLAGGRVGTAVDPLFGRPAGVAAAAAGGRGRSGEERDGEDEDDDNDEEDESSSDEDMGAGGREGEDGGAGLEPSPMKPRKKGKGRAAPPWGALPRPQSVVRCPPINWSQYAVVGDSLDKLHSEQLARPAQGAPAVVGPGGAYEFRGEPNPADGKRLVGIAAPYTPGRDKIDKRPKGPRR